jgi:hypothetical protein
MPYRPRPEAEEEPPKRDTAQRLRTIERWLHHAEEELLYAPDAAEEATATPLDARYYLRWGGGVPFCSRFLKNDGTIAYKR